jgi:hypothetical protein
VVRRRRGEVLLRGGPIGEGEATLHAVEGVEVVGPEGVRLVGEGGDRLDLAVGIERSQVLDAEPVGEAHRAPARELAAPAAEVAPEEEGRRVVGGAEHLVRPGRREDGVERLGAVDAVGRARVVGAEPVAPAEGVERLAAVVAHIPGVDGPDVAVPAAVVQPLGQLLRAVAERVRAREEAAGPRPDAVVAHLDAREEGGTVEEQALLLEEVGFELEVQHVGELGQVPVVRGVEVAACRTWSS